MPLFSSPSELGWNLLGTVSVRPHPLAAGPAACLQLFMTSSKVVFFSVCGSCVVTISALLRWITYSCWHSLSWGHVGYVSAGVELIYRYVRCATFLPDCKWHFFAVISVWSWDWWLWLVRNTAKIIYCLFLLMLGSESFERRQRSILERINGHSQ